MPITSWIKELGAPNQDGGRHVVVRQYDQDGREYMYSFFAASGVDIDTIIVSRIADMDEQLAQSEFEALIGAA